MKKIVLILNATHTPAQLIKTALKIAKGSNSLLEAIFLNDINSLNFSYPFPNDMYLTGEHPSAKTRSEENMKLMRSIATEFRDACEAAEIEFSIEIDSTVSFARLISLSRFADLIIADSKSDSDEYSLRDLLADAHCPLLLVSKNAEPVQKIFIAYDGTPSSMYAVKMFSYIFPEYKDYQVHLFQIADADTVRIKHIEEIKSWASKHFSNIKFELITGNVKNELVTYIRPESEKIIIVMGAYSGSAIARLFLKSTAESVIDGTNASLFITHQ
ncbi:MAG: universal stress protein [Ferruginibacter sp.]